MTHFPVERGYGHRVPKYVPLYRHNALHRSTDRNFSVAIQRPVITSILSCHDDKKSMITGLKANRTVSLSTGLCMTKMTAKCKHELVMIHVADLIHKVPNYRVLEFRPFQVFWIGPEGDEPLIRGEAKPINGEQGIIKAVIYVDVGFLDENLCPKFPSRWVSLVEYKIEWCSSTV